MVSLTKHFSSIEIIKSQLLFFPNNSIYKIGNKIRYVEYEFVNEIREYIISSATLSNELLQILNFTKQGKTMQQITEILVNDDITEFEAKEFIEELIDNQILVSEIEPNVSGKNFLDVLITFLNRINAKNEVEVLTRIKSKLEEIDLRIGNSLTLYSEIENLLKSVKISYNQKYLFQTDLYYSENYNLSSNLKSDLKKAIILLNKISFPPHETHLENFKKAFYERFENQEVPLVFVLDTEVGIGYRQDVSTKGLHKYLENIEIPLLKEASNLRIELNSVEQILNEKVQEALLNGKYNIELFEEDFINYKENWDNLPDTLSFMLEINSENNLEKIVLHRNGGCSAANLIGRFCSDRAEIQKLAKTIAQKEEELNPNYILAEVIHLPEARIGNIIRRPTLRQYEIPYLAQSVLPKENQIPVEDLYISLKNDKIVLRSKKLNKEIKPYLTNAHNYSANPLPVYHFLCDLHSQNTRTGLYFNWGGLSQIYKFFPRVEYQNIILSKAQWNITEKDIASLESIINDKTYFLLKMEMWRSKRQIPKWIQWVKSDNTLPMNLENYDMAKLFLQTIKSEKSIKVEEFLYNENDDFKREFIFPMYKEKIEIR